MSNDRLQFDRTRLQIAQAVKLEPDLVEGLWPKDPWHVTRMVEPANKQRTMSDDEARQTCSEAIDQMNKQRKKQRNE